VHYDHATNLQERRAASELPYKGVFGKVFEMRRKKPFKASLKSKKK
jgi:hypothetical protein